MRIALSHMRHAHAGGTERHLNQVAAHLAEAGHAVTVLCRTHEGAPHPAVRFVTLRPFALGPGWRLVSFARAVERHLAGHAYDVVYGLGRTWTQDVLRLGGGSHATYLRLAHGATRVGAKWLTGAFATKHRAALWVERRAFRARDLRRVVVNSRMVQEDIMGRYGLPASRFELIYNGVDPERFHPTFHAAAGARVRREMAIPTGAPVILFLGSGYARKGLDCALRAFASLPGSAAHLLVVGYDSARAHYAARAAELSVAGRTHFLGGRRDTESCYAAADLYVLPTRYDPFANTTLEALASGLPVLTTRANGAHELLEGAAGAVLPGPEDVQAWATAMAAWLAPGRLGPASQAARRLAERHSAASKMRQTAELLEAVAREKGTVSPVVRASGGGER